VTCGLKDEGKAHFSKEGKITAHFSCAIPKQYVEILETGFSINVFLWVGVKKIPLTSGKKYDAEEIGVQSKPRFLKSQKFIQDS